MYSSQKARAAMVVRRLSEAWQHGVHVYSDTKELLENQIPSGVQPRSREHANFLFYLISQDHGTKSAPLYERAKKLYAGKAEYFEPHYITEKYSTNAPTSLLDFLKSLGVRYPNNATKAWLNNSYRLVEEFGGDARGLFKVGENAKETMERIRSFHGFGPKIGGLLYRVFVGIGVANPVNVNGIDFPTDIHDTRIAGMTGIADIPPDITESNYSPYVNRAQKVWREACDQEGINWLQVDRALWILGSKGCVNSLHDGCPIRELCVKGDREFEYDRR